MGMLPWVSINKTIWKIAHENKTFLENFAHLGKSQKVSMHKWKFSLAVVQ
jgi:hypothetical protein